MRGPSPALAAAAAPREGNWSRTPRADLDDAIETAVADGRAAWPGIMVSARRLGAHARRVGATKETVIKHGSDLYLACACAQRDLMAMERFEGCVLPRIYPYLKRLGAREGIAEDLRQDLCLTLLLNHPPGIAAYSGRGTLLSWLRVIAGRMACRRARPLVLLLPAVLEATESLSMDPETRAMCRILGPRLRQALEESLAALSPQEKEILRLHYAGGQNIDTLGARYRFHRATAARRLAGIRSQVVTEMRERLAPPPRSAEEPRAELGPLGEALSGELHPSLERFLRS